MCDSKNIRTSCESTSAANVTKLYYFYGLFVAFRWKTSKYLLASVKRTEFHAQVSSKQSTCSREGTWRKCYHAFSSLEARLEQTASYLAYSVFFIILLVTTLHMLDHHCHRHSCHQSPTFSSLFTPDLKHTSSSSHSTISSSIANLSCRLSFRPGLSLSHYL